MVNFNGTVLPENELFINHENRGLRYGDSLFETMRVSQSRIFFWEDHYLRLMASMRLLRMEIPMSFTMEFLENEVLQILRANGLEKEAARVRLTIFRNNGGLYLPTDQNVSYIIETSALEVAFYTLSDAPYEVELYKDFYINPDMLSTLKTNNKLIHVVGSIFAKENGYQNCLLINQQKEVVEALNGNLFVVKEQHIKTPSLQSGCLNGTIRKKLLGILDKQDTYTFEETAVSPFELQKADELFITNSIVGIQPITKYRKKEFTSLVAKDLLAKLNAHARLV